jgi:hypothetical protein
MINGSFKKAFGILNKNKSAFTIMKGCFFTKNLFKINAYNFSSAINEGKTTIELIKILRAETSKKFIK